MPDVTEDRWFAEDVATFGDRLAAAREAQGMSPNEFAERLGVRVRTVRQWEDDVMEPRGNRQQMMAGMLNVSMRWLLTGEGPGVAGPDEAAGSNLPRLLGDLRGLHREASRLASRIATLETRVERLIAREAA